MGNNLYELFYFLSKKLSGNVLKKGKIKLLNFFKSLNYKFKIGYQLMKLSKGNKHSNFLKEKIFLPIFYINLERKKKRDLNISSYLDSYFININRVNAIDGLKLEGNCFKGEIDYFSYDFTDFSEVNNCFEVACLLSHLKVIEIINQKNLDYALVLEDDVSLEVISKWDESLDEIILNCPKDFDIIKLHFQKSKLYKNLKLLNKNIRYRKLDFIPDREWSTAAMVYSKKGIMSLTKKFNFENLVLSRDEYKLLVADYVLYKGLLVYEYTKPLFTTLNDASTIRPNLKGGNQYFMNKIIRKIYN